MGNKLYKKNDNVSKVLDTLRAKLECTEPTPIRLAAEHVTAQAVVFAKHTKALAIQAMEHAAALAALTEQAAEIAELAEEQANSLGDVGVEFIAAQVRNKSAALAKITAEIEDLALRRAAVIDKLTAELVEVQTGLIEVYLEHKYLRMKVNHHADSEGRLKRKVKST